MNLNCFSFSATRCARGFLSSLLVSACAFVVAPTSVIAEATIYVPNDNLERYLIQQGFDTGALDDQISSSAAQRITRLDLANLDINSLQGVESFKNLEYLDVSGNDELGDIYLQNVDLKNLKTFKAANTKITLFSTTSTSLENVDFSNNRNIERLDILGARLKTLNLSGATKMKYIWINGGSLTSVDLSSQTELIELRLTSNKLATIDLSPLTKISRIELTNNRLSSIDLSKNPSLELLYLANNKLSSVDLSKNPILRSVNMASNQLSQIDMTPNTRLVSINLSDNSLTSVKIPKTRFVSSLLLNGNQLKTIDVRGLPELFSFEVAANQLRKIDVRDNTRIAELNVGFNPLNKLLLPSDPSPLNYLNISSTKIKRLDLRNTNLNAASIGADDFFANFVVDGNGIAGVGLCSIGTKATIVVDNPALTRSVSGSCLDSNVKLVRK